MLSSMKTELELLMSVMINGAPIQLSLGINIPVIVCLMKQAYINKFIRNLDLCPYVFLHSGTTVSSKDFQPYRGICLCDIEDTVQAWNSVRTLSSSFKGFRRYGATCCVCSAPPLNVPNDFLIFDFSECDEVNMVFDEKLLWAEDGKDVALVREMIKQLPSDNDDDSFDVAKLLYAAAGFLNDSGNLAEYSMSISSIIENSKAYFDGAFLAGKFPQMLKKLISEDPSIEICDYPKISIENYRNLDRILVVDNANIYMRDFLLKRLISDWLDAGLKINSVKKFLCDEGFLDASYKDGYTKKITLIVSAGSSIQSLFLAFRRSRFSEFGQLNFVEELIMLRGDTVDEY